MGQSKQQEMFDIQIDGNGFTEFYFVAVGKLINWQLCAISKNS